jgi:hypothetical protein
VAIIFAKARLHGKGKLSVQEQHLRLQPVPPPTPAEKQRAAAWARDVERWKAVKAAKVPGVSWDAAREIAAEKLAGGFASGKARTMRKAYDLVQATVRPK